MRMVQEIDIDLRTMVRGDDDKARSCFVVVVPQVGGGVHGDGTPVIPDRNASRRWIGTANRRPCPETRCVGPHPLISPRPCCAPPRIRHRGFANVGRW